MEFQRFLFDIAVNHHDIAKYTDGDQVKLVHRYKGDDRESVTMHEDDYEALLEAKVSDRYAPRAQDLQNILDHLFPAFIAPSNAEHQRRYRERNKPARPLIKRETKQRLDAYRGERTEDQAVSDLLRLAGW